MGDRVAQCEERIADIVAAGGNPYKVLQLTEAATEAEVKKAYRKTVLLVHPDKVPAEVAERAGDAFAAAEAAYSLLLDGEALAKWQAAQNPALAAAAIGFALGVLLASARARRK